MSSAIKSHLFTALVIGVVAACGSSAEYVYAPERPSVWIDGYPGTARALPPERPQGEIRLASFGVTELAAAGHERVVALHVRMVVSNEGDATPWTLDTGEQMIEIAGEGRSRAVFVNTDVDGLPMVTIGKRERRTLDFYFPLPATARSEDAIPAFDVLWQVRTADRIVDERTAFARENVEPPPRTEVILVSGWGPRWWYNPLYPTLVFVHPPRVIVRHSPSRIVIHRYPTRHRYVVRDHRRDHRK
jgi:hypothetical protein